MTEPASRSFKLVSQGADAEMDRIGIMWECLCEADYSEALRILDYLRLRVQSQCGSLTGGNLGQGLMSAQMKMQEAQREQVRRY